MNKWQPYPPSNHVFSREETNNYQTSVFKLQSQYNFMIFNVTTTDKLLSHTSAITWERKHS